MVNMSTLSNKVAIVTGASKGIGDGIAPALGAAGARVAVNYSSDREGAERVAQAITDNYNAGVFSFSPFAEITEESFHLHYAIRVVPAPFWLGSAARPARSR